MIDPLRKLSRSGVPELLLILTPADGDEAERIPLPLEPRAKSDLVVECIPVRMGADLEVEKRIY